MANKEKVSISMMVQPQLDQKASKDLYRDIASLHKKLSNVKVDFKDLAKASSNNIKQINDMASAADIFAKRLSKGAQDSYKNLKKLGDELEQAVAEAESLKKAQSFATSKVAKNNIAKLQQVQAQKINSLNKQIDSTKASFAKYGNEMRKVQKAQQKYHANLENMGKYSGKDMRDGLMKGFMQMTRKGGGVEGTAQVFKSLGRGAGGTIARGVTNRAAVGGAGSGKAMMAMRGVAMAAAGIAAAAASIGVLVKLLMAASEHQTKLNKTLLDGTGFANDFTASARSYKGAVDDVRNAAMDSAGALLKFGMRSEQTLKVINQFAKESTGSLIRTRNELIKMGDGDIAKGMGKLARSALAYGKALGMETDQVGSMMGNFVGEIGYGTKNVQSLMSDIVSAAATSNMPVHKFMDIFRQTIPHLELFTNRIEELTGSIKLLSKNMSPGDVKKFIESFSKGWSEDSFKSRLKRTQVAGVDYTNNLLAKSFQQRTKTLSAQMGGDIGESFEKAMASGKMGDMSAAVTKMQARGVDASIIGEAQKLFMSENARRKGGALGTATALKAATMFDRIQMIKKERGTITGGRGLIQGMDEHVMERLDVDQKQINSMNQMIMAVSANQQSLQQYGMTTSKSMNKALRNMAISKIKGRDEVVTESAIVAEMRKMSERELFEAASISEGERKIELTAADLAAQQVNQTMSISEKMDNVIAFWLEKIYQFLQPVLDNISSKINSFVAWITGDKDSHKQMKGAMSWQSGVAKAYVNDPAFVKQMSMVTDQLTDDLSSGKSGAELGRSVGSRMSYANLDENSLAKVEQYIRSRYEQTGSIGTDRRGQARANKNINDVMTKMGFGDMTGAMAAFTKMGGNDVLELQELSKVIASLAGVSDAARASVSLGPSRRIGTKALDPIQYKKELDAAVEASDIETLHPDYKGKGGKVPIISLSSSNNDDGPDWDKIDVLGDNSKEDLEQSKKMARLGEDQKKQQEKQTRMMASGVAVNATHKTEKVVNKATLEAFRAALTEFAIHEARMGANEEYAKTFTDYSWHMATQGQTLGGLGAIGGWRDRENIEKAITGHKHFGGPVDSTGTYRLLKGEHVLTQRVVSQIESGRGGGIGGRPIHAEVHLHGTNIGEAAAQRMVEHAMANISRRQ